MATTSLIRYETIFESTENLPMIIAIGHGENADLVASFKDGGIDVALEGYTARAIFQPKSEWGTDNWYECPCEVSGNTAIAHWGNTYDNGDNAVKLFMHLVKDGKLAYPAIYQIRLFETPGFSPSAIEPIPETIDFSQYTLINAPWALQTDFNTLSGNVNTLSNAIGDTEYLIKRNQHYQVGINNDIAEILLTGKENASWPKITFDNRSRSGDVYDLQTPTETTGEERQHHIINLPNLDGTLVVDSQLNALATEVGDVDSKIYNKGIKLITGGSTSTFTLRNRMLHYIQRPNTYSLTINLKLLQPDHETFSLFYCIVDVKNIAPSPSQYSSDCTIILNQPNGYTWPILVDKGLTLNEVLTIPAGDIARYYISQVGTYGPGNTGNWDALYIKRVLFSSAT